MRAILTDDGSEFIDFRSNCQKQASGEHEFDRLWQRWRLSTDSPGDKPDGRAF
ncbi:hypothetical protein [Laribacter hongkongensis]|uniref:Uncharacterized protein n=1 Tax=Laribacter hongkongensis (strain HLHK9) TaxID=557598 RepID=C1D7R4_LARHH|nr:hypothetical protein LHK_01515 [Laribacter hongkongensis HLHK9]